MNPAWGLASAIKGGAAGGGYAQVVPMEDINLHFTGDFHAIGAPRNNLLSAMIDNHIATGVTSSIIDPRRITWRRVMDMNDRALRHIAVLPRRSSVNGFPREDGFDITVASEVMAIFCLAEDMLTIFGDGSATLSLVTPAAPTRGDHRSRSLTPTAPWRYCCKDALHAESGTNPGAQSGLHPRRTLSPISPTVATR